MIAEMQSKATLDQIQNGPLPHVPGLDGIPSRKARDRAVEMAYGTCAKGMNRIFGGKFGSLNERFQDIQAQLDDRVTKQSLKTVVETMGNTMLAAFRQAWPTVFLESSADEADGGGDGGEGTPTQAVAPGGVLVTPNNQREMPQMKESLEKNRKHLDVTVGGKMWKEGFRYLYENQNPEEVKKEEKWVRTIADNDLLLRSEMERRIAKQWIREAIQEKLRVMLRNHSDQHRKNLTEKGKYRLVLLGVNMGKPNWRFCFCSEKRRADKHPPRTGTNGHLLFGKRFRAQETGKPSAG